MLNRKFFFDQAKRTLFDGKLNQSQVLGLSSILDYWEANLADKDHRWLAYCLGTAHHETDRTMQGIEEYGKGRNLPYGRRLRMDRKPYTDVTGIFYGRGLVQLTWYENYKKAGDKLGVDLLHNPEKALDLKYAVPIMFIGMMEGWFTGAKLERYFYSNMSSWKGARAIINGKDKAELVASYAQRYYACIAVIPD